MYVSCVFATSFVRGMVCLHVHSFVVQSIYLRGGLSLGVSTSNVYFSGVLVGQINVHIHKVISAESR